MLSFFAITVAEMFLSTNMILRAVSRIVHNHFLSVSSQYGVTACTISKGASRMPHGSHFLVPHFRQLLLFFFKICPTLFSLVF